MLSLLGYDCAALSLELGVSGQSTEQKLYTCTDVFLNSREPICPTFPGIIGCLLGRLYRPWDCNHLGCVLSAGRETNDLTLAWSAVRQLQARLTGGLAGTEGADLCYLAQAVSLAVKAASRLRKVVADAAEVGCSHGVAATLANSLEAAAGLVESAEGLQSAAGSSFWPQTPCITCCNGSQV